MKNNAYDQDDYTAFVLDSSRIKTDDREEDEFSPEFMLSQYDEPETDFFR
jgi:hypothetical protein